MRLKKYLFFATVFILAILISAFAHFRNSKRLVKKVMVNFESQGAQFLSDSLVDKLLYKTKGDFRGRLKIV